MNQISKKLGIIAGVITACSAPNLPAEDTSKSLRPNVVLIYTDDVGFGDLSSMGATAVKTPNIDRIAEQGVTFFNGRSPAATCTPSRYSLLTGEYPFRNSRAQILAGDAPALIKPGQFTMADVFKSSGYATAIVGKWHLGLGEGNLDWNEAIKPGPLEIGFDYSFLIPATGDRVPTVFVENHHVYNLDPNDPIRVSYSEPIHELPTGYQHPEMLKQLPTDNEHDKTIINGISRIGYMSGGESAWWVDEDIADVLTEKALSFIESRQENPFFLMFSTHDIHVPRVPHKRFSGETPLGLYGDALLQLDWCVGQLIKKLEDLNLWENTIFIFTSDNGPVLDDGYADRSPELTALASHNPSGVLRGGKASRYEGATRLPFLVSWPKVIEGGITSDALISHMDLPATFASLLDVSVPEGQLRDSQKLLGAFLGKEPDGRDHWVAMGPGGYAIIASGWKFITPGRVTESMTKPYEWLEISAPGELYYLTDDIGERNNLAASHPEKLSELRRLLQKILDQ